MGFRSLTVKIYLWAFRVNLFYLKRKDSSTFISKYLIHFQICCTLYLILDQICLYAF